MYKLQIQPHTQKLAFHVRKVALLQQDETRGEMNYTNQLNRTLKSNSFEGNLRGSRPDIYQNGLYRERLNKRPRERLKIHKGRTAKTDRTERTQIYSALWSWE